MRAKLFALLFAVSLILPTNISAEELTITGNGDGSSNEINIQSSNQTTVNQNSQTNVVNNVDTNTNTGGNDASKNTGDANIQTDNTTTTVNVINNATITNVITINANTGDNHANDNGGEVKIKTGIVKIQENVGNTINNSQIALTSENNSSKININNNGSGSINKIINISQNTQNFNVENSANIKNINTVTTNTGGNSANGNNGGVIILTGDVYVAMTVKNVANVNLIKMETLLCAPKDPGHGGNPDPVPEPVDPPQISSTPTSSNSGPSDPGVGGPNILGLSYTGGSENNFSVWVYIFFGLLLWQFMLD